MEVSKMVKNLICACFIFMAVVLITGTRTTARAKEPTVIDTFSEDYKNNSATSSKQVKVISTFAEDSTKSNSSETQANATISPQDHAQGAPQQTDLGSQANMTEKEPEQDYKVLKSK
jgi:hypothetical protein